MSRAAAVLTTPFLRLSPFGNGDAPMRREDGECREVLALLLLVVLLLQTIVLRGRQSARVFCVVKIMSVSLC